MATNSSIKKSSIPRATHDNDRFDQPKSRLRGPKPPPVAAPHHHHAHPANHQSQSKPGPNDGLLKEDGDSVSRSLLELEADHARMKKTLEDTVQEAEERLAAMEKLMAERERLCSEDLNAVAEKTKNLENQVEDCEKLLIENNIDPVTGEVVKPTEEQKAAVEKQKKVTKGDVSKMREKLHKMNENSEKYLTDVQNILQEIDELEATSQRVCDTSEFQGLSGNDLKALILEVEEAQRKEELQKKKEGAEEEEEGDTEEEEEEEERESPSPRQDEKENLQPPAKPDVFLTQKSSEIHN